MVKWIFFIIFFPSFRTISNFFRFWLGGAGGASQTPPEHSSLAFDRGGQTGPPRSNAFFFGAADDMGAVDDRPTTRSKVYLRHLQNAVIKFLTAISKQKLFDLGGPLWPSRSNAKDDRTMPKKKAFDRGGPVWQPRSNEGHS